MRIHATCVVASIGALILSISCTKSPPSARSTAIGTGATHIATTKATTVPASNPDADTTSRDTSVWGAPPGVEVHFPEPSPGRYQYEYLEKPFQMLEIGTIAPPLAVPTLQGDTARVGPGGPVTLLSFWWSGCADCKAEFPRLVQLDRKLRSRGLRVLAINVARERPEDMRKFLDKNRATFPIGVPRHRIPHYLILGVPISYVIDRRGLVVGRRAGPIDVAETRSLIVRALADTAGSGNAPGPS